MRPFFLSLVLLCGFNAYAQDKKPITVPVASASAPALVTPADAATPEQIREYFTLVHLDATMKNLMASMVAAMKSTAAPYIPNSFWEDMTQTMSSFDFLAELIPIYQKHISRVDMVGVLAFYRSDAGKHLLENQAVVTTEAQDTFRAIGGRLGEQVGERHTDEIVAAKKKYEEGIADRQMLKPSPDPKF